MLDFHGFPACATCHLLGLLFTGLTMSGLDSIGAIYKPIIKHKFFMTLGLVERTCCDLEWMYSIFFGFYETNPLGHIVGTVMMVW